MLQKLVIRNYAIIDRLTIEPGAHLNTITGETGAGKSIILGALSLILGERADTSVLINKEEKCVVEAYFDVTHHAAFKSALRQEELDVEDQCIIRREISASGKSRAFVNDTPVVLGVLNRLTGLLVDLQQQFAHLELEDDQFSADVLDAVAGCAELRSRYQQFYSEHQQLARQLAELRKQQDDWQKESDYKQFLYDELTQAAFGSEEIEEAESRLKQFSNAEKILQVLSASHGTLELGEQPMTNELKKIIQQLQSISDVLPEVQGLQERLSSAYAELRDIAGELEDLQDKVSVDPSEMQRLQERMDLGYKLFKKHAVRSTAELLEVQQRLEADLRASQDLAEDIARLDKQQDTVFTTMMAAAKELTKARKAAIPALENRINELLKLVGMPNAEFRISLAPLERPGAIGGDDIEFLLDANKSGQFLPVYKAASGGEMSRIMLCIKSMVASAMQLPTLIFDEVDAGISGEAARQVGLLLQELGRHHQLICITHQPQVAARGDRHFFVYKDDDGSGRITTRLKQLQPDERVLAIARMIGGEAPSEAALQNARELVEC